MANACIREPLNPNNYEDAFVSKRFLTSLLLLVAIRTLLDVGYVYYVAPEFGYAGFNLTPSAGSYIASWILYLAVFPMTPNRLQKVSDVVFMLATVSIIAPLTSMYGLSTESIVPVLMSVASMALVFAIVNMKLFRVVRFPYLRAGERLAVLFSAAVVLLVTLHYLMAGVHLNLNLVKVYDFRSLNADSAARGIFAYMNSWAYQAFNLFLIAICLMRRRYVLVAALLVVQVFFFAASQQKSVLFAPIVIVGVWWYLRRSDNLLIVPAVLFALVAVSLLAFVAYNNTLVASLALRRIFFVPAHLSFSYYSFFTEHPKVYWGDSFWMPFVHSPYPKTIPYVIGQYLGASTMGANNGYVSSGFAQAGVFGVFVYTIILGYILKFVDHESRRLGAVWLGVGLFVLPFMTIWRSSDLSTSMLTHGFLVMLVLLGLLRRPEAGAAVSRFSRSRGSRCAAEGGPTWVRRP